MHSFAKQSRAALRAMIVLTVVFGLLYPALVWGVGQVVARDRAAGSLVEVNGSVVGSHLIGQQWDGDRWFHGRPSASGYAGDTSGGSNLSGSALAAEVTKRAGVTGLDPRSAPADALTASGSGLDPDISPAYALSQVARVASARGLEPSRLRALVAEHAAGRQLALDALAAPSAG
jgi:K+-transporting ATPase ATPase C chain